ncbi:PREDICTED: uncharacterized protein LOC109461782 [Branchiostoma belcheri]|uniref:Uncharacterized protein LOC109461782 n=1 Tax=Branchiostoma belcheri TaxID=7741 RepID=A0A6P4Y4X1_BRABE|nr:PREDICTED: uncharacterized protein LOC109461782 [Branchiostoma belcheri]XP_019613740.1 PREDICTED: uncharacterized protein LOC109461782 [Branchiostoma belcheri]XP_019613741.1 PREDICTED: uncharacterized protein LOC109461782 [Branchiostoma belcheri]XP_019613742.1 PREDICTED: uncharacterized protein LOC109461782 [Branchiostoma belcheri]XP_019613743.1 PREDICTED: uncharacterized protein LOC109461782 [Branchiostoma belcheri]XP_019613744.1 PREDICTED: uncharacterized protein LOC109461782 [Branchiosto
MGRALVLAAMCLAVTFCSHTMAADDSEFCSDMTLYELYCDSCKYMFLKTIHDTANRTHQDLSLVLCSWPDVIQPYFKLTRCQERVASLMNCSDETLHILRDEFMLSVHRNFFAHCNGTHSQEEDPEMDDFLEMISAISSVSVAVVILILALLITTTCSPRKYIKFCCSNEM